MGQTKNRRYIPQLRRPSMDGLVTAFTGGAGGGAAAATTGAKAGGPPIAKPAGVSVIPDEGPTQAGGLLKDAPGRGITAPGVSRDIITSRYGPRIDLGPIFRPQSTGVDPMTGDPFKATSGVGGFFRRLLGDNSDELNSQWQQYRLANELEGRSKADERAFELDKLRLQDQLIGAREAAGRTFAGSEAEKDRAARAAAAGEQRMFDIGQTGRKEHFEMQSDAQRAAAKLAADAEQRRHEMRLQGLRGEQGLREVEERNKGLLDKAVMGGRAEQPVKVGDNYWYQGRLHMPDDNGRFPTLPGGAPEPAIGSSGPTDAQRQAVKQAFMGAKSVDETPNMPPDQGPPSPQMQFETRMGELPYAAQPALSQAFAKSALDRAEFAPTQVGGSSIYRDPASALEARTPDIMKQFSALPPAVQTDIYRGALSNIEGLDPDTLATKAKKAGIRPLFSLPYSIR